MLEQNINYIKSVIDKNECIDFINTLDIPSLFKVLEKLSDENIIMFLKNENIVNLKPQVFNVLFLRSSDQVKKSILENKKLFDKAINLKVSTQNILDVLAQNYPISFNQILNSPYMEKYMDKFDEFFNKISNSNLKKYLSQYDFATVYKNFGFLKDEKTLRNYIDNNICKISDDEFNLLLSRIKNNCINPIHLLKVNNEKELSILNRFNLVIKVELDSKNLILQDGKVFPYEDVLNLKTSQIYSLINIIKQKDNISEDYEILEAVLNLYYIFGYDNSKKIIEDKFTYLNNNCINRIVDFNFKDERREYRFNNQNKFYYFGLENKVLKALTEKEYEYIIENIIGDTSKEKIIEFKKRLSQLVIENDSTKLEEVKKFINEVIMDREEKYKSIMRKEIIQRIEHKINNKDNLKKIDAKVINKLLENVDILKFKETYDEKNNELLQKVLLGNMKKDNDCLLRLMLNEECFGLEYNVSNFINNFHLIKSIAEKSNLSLNSVLDIIDIMKIQFFNLRPNEKDIYLSTLSKVIACKKFCEDPSVDILKETCILHAERKKKVYSSIPTVEGTCGDVRYYVAPFDAEFLLSAGVDSENCFRIAGLGEQFFRYCLTNPQAVIIILEKNNKKYFCPTIRSGNGLHVNGIDPEIPQVDKQSILNALNMCFKNIISESNINQDKHKNIEVCTLSDLHLKDDLKKYTKYNKEAVFPINENCYSDYNKPEITNYILCQTDGYKENYYYESTDKFYQIRNEVFEYNVDKEYDSKRIEIILNIIGYSSIDFESISEKDKKARKRLYKQIDINKYLYIMGNKDWYVLIDKNLNIVANLLPYDKRAIEEYKIALRKAPVIVEKLMCEREKYGIKK